MHTASLSLNKGSIIAVLGAAVKDISYKGALPKRGQLIKGSIKVTPGGDPVLIGLHLANQGHNVRAIIKVGLDRDGDYMIDALNGKVMLPGFIFGAANAIDTTYIQRSGKTATSIVLVDEKGERSFLHDEGANAEFCDKDIMAIFETAMTDVGWLDVSELGIMPAFWGSSIGRILSASRKLGIINSLSFSGDISGDIKRRLHPINIDQISNALRNTDLLISSINELSPLTGQKSPQKVVRFLQRHFRIPVVVVTMGQKGCFFIDSNSRCEAVPAKEVNALNCNGAGAVFKAAFIDALIKSGGKDAFEAANSASTAAASFLESRNNGIL